MSAGCAGKRGGDPKKQQQCLFLPYIEAVSVTVAGNENRRPNQQQYSGGGGGSTCGTSSSISCGVESEELNFLPPNMPAFTRLDLDFICTFTEVRQGWPVGLMAGGGMWERPLGCLVEVAYGPMSVECVCCSRPYQPAVSLQGQRGSRMDQQAACILKVAL